MDIILFKDDKFDPANINGYIDRPENVHSKLISTIINYCPKDIILNDYPNVTSISYNKKKVNISLFKFKLNDYKCDDNLFEQFKNNESDIIIVWNIKFYENNILCNNIRHSDLSCATGYKFNEERKALFMLSTKVMMYIRSFNEDIKELFANEDIFINSIINKLPKTTSIIDKSKLTFKVNVPINDYIATFTYSNGNLHAMIPHKYTECDRAYGAQFQNYSVDIKFYSLDEINKFNWNSLLHDLYINKNGKCIYEGSLGS